MKQKLLKLLPLAILFSFFLCYFSMFWGIILIFAEVLFGSLILLFIVLNKLVKNTNWWKNRYSGTEQFVSNKGYRENIIRNYDIINLGSNPARYAFFYEDVKGQSWATGSQGQDMDFEILKYYHSYLRQGATVLIPIMPFTAISTYLKERPDYWGMAYYTKFAKILDSSQSNKMPYGKSLRMYLNYPLLYDWKAIKYLLFDLKPNSTYQISEQPMMKMELEQDSSKWIADWMKEFNLCSLNEVFDDRWKKYYNEAISINQQMVEYCLERGYKPVFICVPMTKHLSSIFPEEFWKYMISDFVKKANKRGVPFVDYTFDDRFSDDSLYFNSFFLNLRGRKIFTAQVIKYIYVC